MRHSIALNFEDGVTRFIECRPDETIADASYRVGINIPLDCRDGVCGTCKCRVEAGEYDRGSYLEDALTEKEAAVGLALACQTRPKTDLVVAVAASSEFCRTGAQTYRTRLHSVDRLSETTIAFSLDRADAFSFLPGQYANISVPGTDQRRSYSFSSPPGAETLSFLVRNIPPGVMSTYLRENAVPGTSVEFIGPAGSFYLREIKRPLLLLAGGTGLAPFLAMLGKIAETGSAHPIHLVCGVTNDVDLVGVERLTEFATKIRGFTFVTCVAAADSAHPRKGYVMAHVETSHLNGGDVDVYLCGPPPMVDAVRAWLGEQSMTPANFYYEKFAPSGLVTAVAACDVKRVRRVSSVSLTRS
jgi:benzoate/toluate 1,2-dioxygenase reductase component